MMESVVCRESRVLGQRECGVNSLGSSPNRLRRHEGRVFRLRRTFCGDVSWIKCLDHLTEVVL
jgi:hypothetical protein